MAASEESKPDELKKDDDKEARRKRKELRRAERAQFQARLKAVDQSVASLRNPIIVEIIETHLKQDLSVFQARWQTGNVLSNDVFLNTPLFWYKKHKWSHKDVKEFFKIVEIYNADLEAELNIVWGIDDTAKRKKKEKRKKLKEKHLRKESFASLLTLRHSSLALMQTRSMNFTPQHDPKAETASISIWNFLVKNRDDAETCAELNHAQFNIALVDNEIAVDPDMSVDLFYELIRTWEIIEAHREDKRLHPEKYAKKSRYKQSKSASAATGSSGPSMKQIGGSSAFFMQPQSPASPVAEEASSEPSDSKKKEDEADLPQKDKIKYIKKRTINRQYIKRMLRHIAKNIKRVHQIAAPKKLKKSKLLLVVLGKIFDAVQNQQPFDVQDDYLSQALTPDQLNSPSELLDILATRDAEWKQRVQVLEYLESNIVSNEALLPLFEEENFLLLVVGWTTQLYDERSRITQTAAELFPSLLTILLTRMETPALIFEPEHACLDTILEALFTLLKNKRAKTLSEIAHDVLIETINILATVAEDLDETANHRIAQFLHLHTQFEHEKHEKVRAGCIAYSLFMVFGTESQELHNEQLRLSATSQGSPNSPNQLTVEALGKAHGPQALNKSLSINSVDSEVPASPVGSDNEEDGDGDEEEEKGHSLEVSGASSALSVSSAGGGHVLTASESKLMLFDKSAKEKNVKIAKQPQRAYLLDDAVFMELFAKMIGNGIEDRGKESREKAMKVLKKIEATRPSVLEEYIAAHHVAKYEKWKKFNASKSGKGKKGKGKKGSKRKRISPIKRMKSTPAQKKEKVNAGDEADPAPVERAKTIAVLATATEAIEDETQADANAADAVVVANAAEQ